jgi:excisionase family DNA binding protein
VSIAEQIEKIGRALTADDLARLLSISKVAVYKHAAEGKIPSFRIGVSIRFDPHSVATWLRKKGV